MESVFLRLVTLMLLSWSDGKSDSEIESVLRNEISEISVSALPYNNQRLLKRTPDN